MAKFIFITGGVVSSLGKGIATASIGALLEGHGYKIIMKKLDPYLNIDPGTMNPAQHGEVFVTEDGAETDMDLGHYERFTNFIAEKHDSTTSGKLYLKLLEKERKGEYLGSTVQVIPHVTNLIKDFITHRENNADVILCEIGGTVGDIEALPFFEAIRQMSYDKPENSVIYIHLTLIPFLKHSLELKTKPTQHSVKELRSIGIQPNIILCRSEKTLPISAKRKIGLYCNLKEEHIIQSPDSESIYEIPLQYHEELLDKQILNLLGMDFKKEIDLEIWRSIKNARANINESVNISLVGKYDLHQESYKSLIEAFRHVEIKNKCNIQISFIEVDDSRNFISKLKKSHAIIIPGGFGKRGIDEKILAIKFARENNIPFLGICLGMQLAVIEYARNVLGMKDANSTEFDINCHNNVIDILDDQLEGNNLQNSSKNRKIGGTMRLGAYECSIKKETKLHDIYQNLKISERHRHRYEFNNKFTNKFLNTEMVFSGISYKENQYVEAVELKNHRWFIGVQFHPEYKSHPFNPHPIFVSLINAALLYKKENL